MASRPALRVTRGAGVTLAAEVALDPWLDQHLPAELARCQAAAIAWLRDAGVPCRPPAPLLCVLAAGPEPGPELRAAVAAHVATLAAAPFQFALGPERDPVATLWRAREQVARHVVTDLAGIESEEPRQRWFVVGLCARLADAVVAGRAVLSPERDACLRQVQQRGDLMARFHGKGLLQHPEVGPEDWAIGWLLLHFLEFGQGGRRRSAVPAYAAALAGHTASHETLADVLAIDDMAEFGQAWQAHLATCLTRGPAWLERGGPADPPASRRTRR